MEFTTTFFTSNASEFEDNTTHASICDQNSYPVFDEISLTDAIFIVTLTILVNIVLFLIYKNDMTSSSRKHLFTLLFVDVIGTCVTESFNVIATQTRDQNTRVYMYMYWICLAAYGIAYHMVLLFWCGKLTRETLKRFDKKLHEKFRFEISAHYIFQIIICLWFLIYYFEKYGSCFEFSYEFLLEGIISIPLALLLESVILFLPFLIVVKSFLLRLAMPLIPITISLSSIW